MYVYSYVELQNLPFRRGISQQNSIMHIRKGACRTGYFMYYIFQEGHQYNVYCLSISFSRDKIAVVHSY